MEKLKNNLSSICQYDVTTRQLYLKENQIGGNKKKCISNLMHITRFVNNL
jgi:hypothetical protein